MRVETCHFCSRPAYPSKGITFVRNDARVFRFCRSKCHKNFKMKRNPRKLGWTKAFRHAHGKEMIVDGALALAAKRNIPVRYNREMVAKTLGAMQRVAEIKARREKRFYKERMKGNRERTLEADRKLVRENQHLLPPQERDRVEELLQEDLSSEEEEQQEEMTIEDSIRSKEESLRKEIRAADAKRAPEAKKRKTPRRVIVGHGVEKMDVDN